MNSESIVTLKNEPSNLPGGASRLRLAIVVTHPIQYYAPLYRLLAARDDIALRVFFTWHAGDKAILDRGFQRDVAWDIPLTDGYDWEIVENKSRHPGVDHFFGIQNPTLNRTVSAWRPNAIHLTGYNYASHLSLLRHFGRSDIPVLFRGDSHLLSPRPLWKRVARSLLLRQVFRYPAALLYVGKHNRDYYRAHGVPESKLFYSPHSIDYHRFAAQEEARTTEASAWRTELGIRPDQVVVLFAGKFQHKKQPLALVEAMATGELREAVLLMVGDGELKPAIERRAAALNVPVRLLPFQNQTRMPVIYRLGDLLALPSTHDETWGLAVNEAMACGRPALVSSQVGCAPEMIVAGSTGDVFQAGLQADLTAKLISMVALGREGLHAWGRNAQSLAARFDFPATCGGLMVALHSVVRR